eukprot:CAMPEP_0119133676 /NCGR_PEP_ID=MMETSP1310-20130426/13498_1 /TAXON_ID=464262 /ORGANISM="Genus nov. species nov., Strain RCC2339" /LENGTH=300 /DNA_ID=CAMNT_0007124377 /DNA_START=29 /DNA_END=931 /DNA_ORIENTATION=+
MAAAGEYKGFEYKSPFEEERKEKAAMDGTAKHAKPKKKMIEKDDTGIHVDISALLKRSPLPLKLADECEKAILILKREQKVELSKGKGDDGNLLEKADAFLGAIPTSLLQQCYGVAIMKVSKSSFLLGGATGGAGIVVRRVGVKWSCPIPIGVAGLTFGPQFGISSMSVILVLPDETALTALRNNNLKLGASCGVTAGPLGRNAQADINALSTSMVYSYCLTMGLYVGVTLDGSVIVQRPEAVQDFYGVGVTAEDVLTAPPPIHDPNDRDAVEKLHRALDARLNNEEIKLHFDESKHKDV